jgi:hypothetical protein
MASVGSSRIGVVPIGISQQSQSDVLRDFARYATVGEVVAELQQSPPNLENQFSHRWMCYCTDLMV